MLIFTGSMSNSISERWRGIPRELRIFLLRALGLFIAWKCLYLFLLAPDGRLDAALTKEVAENTAGIFNMAYGTESFYAEKENADNPAEEKGIRTTKYAIHNAGRRLIGIADACNALELMILYAGFIICFHADAVRKSVFILGGMALIYIVNLTRCAGLAWVNMNHAAWFSFAHKYLFKMVVYFFIFMLWLLFVRKNSIKAEHGNS
jgi:exosortase family protein XrtF